MFSASASQLGLLEITIILNFDSLLSRVFDIHALFTFLESLKFLFSFHFLFLYVQQRTCNRMYIRCTYVRTTSSLTLNTSFDTLIIPEAAFFRVDFLMHDK